MSDLGAASESSGNLAAQDDEADPFREIRRKRSSAHLPTSAEVAGLVAQRLYHSAAYAVLYGFAILTNMVLLVWLLVLKGAPPSNPALFALLEALVTTSLLGEMAVALKQRGVREYFKDVFVWVDILVATLCVISLMSVLSEAGARQQDGEAAIELTIVVTVMRYASAILRLGALVRSERLAKTTAQVSSLVAPEIIYGEEVPATHDGEVDFSEFEKKPPVSPLAIGGEEQPGLVELAINGSRTSVYSLGSSPRTYYPIATSFSHSVSCTEDAASPNTVDFDMNAMTSANEIGTIPEPKDDLEAQTPEH